MEKEVHITKTQASIIRYAATTAFMPQRDAPSGRVQLIGPERQRAGMGMMRPLRKLFGDDQPNKASDGSWKFVYADKKLYTLRFDDAALAVLRECWALLNRGIFMNDDDSGAEVLAVDDALAAAKDAPVEVTEKAPSGEVERAVARAKKNGAHRVQSAA